MTSFISVYPAALLYFVLNILPAVAQIPSLPQDPNITTPTGARSYCYAIVDFQQACQEQTANWTALPKTEQAKCYCYDTVSNSYVPSVYDNAAQTCYDGYLKTAQTGDASWYSSNNIGACTRFAGPAVTGTGPITAAPTSSSPAAQQTANTTTSGVGTTTAALSSWSARVLLLVLGIWIVTF